MNKRNLLCIHLTFLLFLVGCSGEDSSVPIVEPSAKQAEGRSVPQLGNWPLHGRTDSEQRFSPLDQINDSNVDALGLEWFFDFDTKRGQEATPIVVNGLIYVSTAWSKVFVIDAKSGNLKWKYDPKVPPAWGARTCCDAVNRGVAVWEGQVYIGTLDGRLVSLDATTGEVLWEILTIDPEFHYAITGAPRVIDGKVIIGNGGAEFGVRGYVSAYDAITGEQVWRFYTVPGDPALPFEDPILEEAAKTWNGSWWKMGGGGTVWDSMAYDAELDLLYIGVGNGSPWDRNVRSPGGGDNLFLSSIVALRPDDGTYVWHYQTTPGDHWDYTATQHMILADLVIDGVNRNVIMQAPKNGFFYVLDRATGELISAQPYVPVNWASRIDIETGRPVEIAGARYTVTDGWLAEPGPLGGHNWHPMSYSPVTGLVYVPAQETPVPLISDGNTNPSNVAVNLGVDLVAGGMPQDPIEKGNIMQSLKGRILAWDPIIAKEVWRVEHLGPWNGGILSTAGNLVFQGTAAGGFIAYRADTGESLWSTEVQTGVGAPPVTYEIDGVQYISLVVGWGGAFPLVAGEAAHKSGKQRNVSRLLTFTLNGSSSLPQSRSQLSELVNVTNSDSISDSTVDKGEQVYQRYCSACHGDVAVSGGVIADLRHSAMITSADAFKTVVLDGVFEEKGMISFAEELNESDVEAVRAYIVERTEQSRAAQ